jgi:hypothetical protein
MVSYDKLPTNSLVGFIMLFWLKKPRRRTAPAESLNVV